jgi:hypothetical protein
MNGSIIYHSFHLLFVHPPTHPAVHPSIKHNSELLSSCILGRFVFWKVRVNFCCYYYYYYYHRVCYHLYASSLQLYTSNKPCFYGI